MWYVYIIQCSDNTLYAGITTDVKRRLKEHNTLKGGKYTRTRVPVRLVYTEKYSTKSDALRREIQLKGWTRAKKIALIEKNREKLKQLSHCKARKTSTRHVLKNLKALARPDQLEGMARFGITGKKRLGVSVPDLRSMAKEIGMDHDLALRLWRTGIPDAMILASMIDEPTLLTEEQMDDWVKDLDSWDVCDQVCMNLFDRSPLAWKKIRGWSHRKEEFVRRAAFALLACLAWHDKTAPDPRFTRLFPLIRRGATDDRNYVKKAVNWALRNIGKRNSSLNKAAILCAIDIQQIDSRAARWIARDALRELRSEAVQKRIRRNP